MKVTVLLKVVTHQKEEATERESFCSQPQVMWMEQPDCRTEHWLEVLSVILIGHFRVPLSLCFKARLSVKPFLWKWLWFAWNETAHRTNFRKKGSALRLILKQRHKGTRKWPIELDWIFPDTNYYFINCIRLATVALR